ncbi:MAG: hypothetical protein ACREN5_00865, partial [Gemmatimonadales bacterium]
VQGYSFGSGLAFDRVTQITLPASVVHRFSPRLTVDVSTAFATASVRTAGGSSLSISGLVDTDVRAVLSIVPSRLLFTLVTTLPTGRTSVADTVVPLFGVLATDLLDFSMPSFGSGGAVTGGLASAFRLGSDWALGAAASYRYTLNYSPVAGSGQLEPGDELRLRVGLEGPLGGGTYLRSALVVTASGGDTLTGSQSSITGDRLLGYAAMSLPFGRSVASFYAFDMYRMRPRGFNTTYKNAVQVPRGNVMVLGARLDRPLSPTMRLSPALEFRNEVVGSGNSFQTLGSLFRFGADLRWRVAASATVVFQGQLAFGSVQDQGTSVSVFGPRIGALIEWAR